MFALAQNHDSQIMSRPPPHTPRRACAHTRSGLGHSQPELVDEAARVSVQVARARPDPPGRRVQASASTASPPAPAPAAVEDPVLLRLRPFTEVPPRELAATRTGAAATVRPTSGNLNIMSVTRICDALDCHGSSRARRLVRPRRHVTLRALGRY